MKALVDKDTCIGCGLCASICPEVFEIGDDGLSHVIVDQVQDESKDTCKEAEESCPVAAISTTEE